MATEPKNKPVREFRDGAIKTAVWRREHEGKTFFSISVSRGYKVEQDGVERWEDTNSFDFAHIATVKLQIEMAEKWIKQEMMAAV